MAYGTLPNIANAGHEPTPDERAEQIARNLLKLPRSHFTVIDGTCGEGNLLAPFQGHAHAEMIGIEINGKWAELATQRLPQARIITAAVEHVSIAPGSISLATPQPAVSRHERRPYGAPGVSPDVQHRPAAWHHRLHHPRPQRLGPALHHRLGTALLWGKPRHDFLDTYLHTPCQRSCTFTS
jgi:hypothetical protein